MRGIDWLASYPKSGNTYVRCLMGAYFGATNPNHLPYISTQSDLKTCEYHRVSPKPLAQMNYLEVLGLRSAVLEHLRAAPWGLVKTHNARMEIQDIHLIPKRVTHSAIYLVRDPRDVARSFANHLNRNLDPDLFGYNSVIELMGSDKASILKQDASNLIHILSSWSNHVDSWMKSPFPTLCIKYETLVERPEDQFYKILDFLGLEPDEDRVKEAVEATRIDRMKELEEKEGFREAKNSEFFGGERQRLFPEQIERIEKDHEEVMKALEYI